MQQDYLQENEVVARAVPVKYHDIEYHDNYIVVVQNRTRRRIPNGYWFEDTGVHIYISLFYSHIYQSKSKIRQFIVNTVTKEWRLFETTIVVTHVPEKKLPINTLPDKKFLR